jgi:hypothetical protein
LINFNRICFTIFLRNKQILRFDIYLKTRYYFEGLQTKYS